MWQKERFEMVEFSYAEVNEIAELKDELAKAQDKLTRRNKQIAGLREKVKELKQFPTECPVCKEETIDTVATDERDDNEDTFSDATE